MIVGEEHSRQKEQFLQRPWGGGRGEHGPRKELKEGECHWRADSEGIGLRGEAGAWQGKAKRHEKYFCKSNRNHLWHKVLIVPQYPFPLCSLVFKPQSFGSAHCYLFPRLLCMQMCPSSEQWVVSRRAGFHFLFSSHQLECRHDIGAGGAMPDHEMEAIC